MLILSEYHYKIERDFLGLQLSIIEPWLTQLPTKTELQAALNHYQKELNAIYEDALLGFNSYMNSERAHIFYNDQFIPVSKDTIKMIMENFRKNLNQWIEPYRNFSIQLNSNFHELTHQLQLAYKKTDEAVENIMYEKAELSMPIGDAEANLVRQKEFNIALKRSLATQTESKTAANEHPFLQACEQGNLKELKKHLPVFNKTTFIDTTRNASGETALHIACRRGDIRLLHELITLKAKLEIPVHVPSQDQVNVIHYYPLHWAIKYQQLAIIQFLILHNDINIQTSKFYSTPLHTAVYEQNVNAVQLLLKAGAVIDEAHIDYQGWTPMHYAANKGNLSLLKLILEQYRLKPAQIHIGIKGLEGETALGIAIRQNQYQAAKLFVEYGIGLDQQEIQDLVKLAAKPGCGHIRTIYEALLKQQATAFNEGSEPALSFIQPTATHSLENSTTNNNLSTATRITFFKDVTDVDVVNKKPEHEKKLDNSSSDDECDHAAFEEVSLQPTP